ncbi:hypothetical protein HNR46_004212 [Haloferula luteola]|uniref:Uncharacterized protein n=1 Tax=Haloferula luteola TaxID=595692 RepID=A0A840V7I6_9BACT|nr:hypothetical protein [Haloferula luteola]MBB5353942.1 hypothetical protein [Haloferula luteola]
MERIWLNERGGETDFRGTAGLVSVDLKLDEKGCQISGKIDVEYAIRMNVNPSRDPQFHGKKNYWKGAAHEVELYRAFIQRLGKIIEDAEEWPDNFDSPEEATRKAEEQTETLQNLIREAIIKEASHGDFDEKLDGIDANKEFGTPPNGEAYDWETGQPTNWKN